VCCTDARPICSGKLQFTATRMSHSILVAVICNFLLLVQSFCAQNKSAHFRYTLISLSLPFINAPLNFVTDFVNDLTRSIHSKLEEVVHNAHTVHLPV